MLAKLAGHTVLRLADSRVPQTRQADFAEAVSGYLDEVKKLAEERRETAEVQARMLAAHVYRLASDPNRAGATPVILKPVPYFDFTSLKKAVDRLTNSARIYDTALAKNATQLPDDVIDQLFIRLQQSDQSLAPEAGLPGRPWYKNLIYAPGHLTGYSVKTLPGVREGIEGEHWNDVDRYSRITAAALNAYADGLDGAAALMNRISAASATHH